MSEWQAGPGAKFHFYDLFAFPWIPVVQLCLLHKLAIQIRVKKCWLYSRFAACILGWIDFKTRT